jgi:RNA polymerase sigma-70 factor (ECF subfamily)
MLRLLEPPSAGASLGAPGQSEGRGSGRPGDPLWRLAVLASQGDTDAERTLLVAVGPSLLRAVRGVLGSAGSEVEDTLQEAMVALHLALPRFRGESTTLHFACRVAVQTAMNARRRAGYRTRHTPSAEPAELEELALDECSPADLYAAEQRREGLRQLLCELPDEQAEVLALHAVLGYTIEETAATTQAPINTVRSRLRTALSKLRARIQADGALLETIRGGA